MQRRFRGSVLAWIAAGLLGAMAPQLPAAGAGAQLAISLVVQKQAGIRTHAQRASFTATAEDVALGYVDVPRGTVLEVRSNSAAGLALEFHFVGAAELAGEMHVSGAGRVLRFGPAGGFVQLPGQARGIATHRFDLAYRIFLSPDARPGTYPWPVRITATPL